VACGKPFVGGVGKQVPAKGWCVPRKSVKVMWRARLTLVGDPKGSEPSPVNVCQNATLNLSLQVAWHGLILVLLDLFTLHGI
jgi:hypothetical protein